MDITDDFMPRIPCNPFHAFTDNRRTEMAYMQRLCYVRSAVIYHNFLCLFWVFQPEFRFTCHLWQIILQKRRAYLQIQKARRYRTHFRKNRAALQFLFHILSNHKRRLLIAFCPCHRPVALVFAQVRAIRQSNLPKLCIIPCCLKCLLHFPRYHIQNLLHAISLSFRFSFCYFAFHIHAIQLLSFPIFWIYASTIILAV